VGRIGHTVGQSVVSQIVGGCVEEDEENGQNGCRPGLCGHESLHRDCPGDIDAEQARGTSKVRLPTREAWHSKGQGCSTDKVPARSTDVNLRLDDAVRDIDHIKQVAQIVPEVVSTQTTSSFAFALTRSECFQTTG
jgi:hypothetical protein